MDKDLLKELAFQDEKLKEKIIGPNTKEFIENLSKSYDLEAIKENIEQVNKNNDSIWFKLSTKGFVEWSLGVIFILFLIYWYLWGFFTGLFIGIFSFIILLGALDEPIDVMAGYNELSFSIVKGYNEAKRKDDEINKKK